jgi:hypothetical protein
VLKPRKRRVQAELAEAEAKKQKEQADKNAIAARKAEGKALANEKRLS